MKNSFVIAALFILGMFTAQAKVVYNNEKMLKFGAKPEPMLALLLSLRGTIKLTP
jgi:hypothetical protein